MILVFVSHLVKNVRLTSLGHFLRQTKLDELISEAKAIEEKAVEQDSAMKRNEVTETTETSSDGVKIKVKEEQIKFKIKSGCLTQQPGLQEGEIDW